MEKRIAESQKIEILKESLSLVHTGLEGFILVFGEDNPDTEIIKNILDTSKQREAFLNEKFSL